LLRVARKAQFSGRTGIQQLFLENTGGMCMCNLYSITTNKAAVIALFRVMNRYVGNLPPMPGILPFATPKVGASWQ
jgi:hypothetical protein